MLLELPDFTMHYEDLSGGMPVLCLSAFPFDGRMFAEQASLGDVARLVMPDYRGVGRSSTPAGPYTMDILAQDMFALLDALDIARPVIFGNSMGVYVAFAMYAMNPDRVRGLILADSRAESDTPAQAERRRATVAGLREQGTRVLEERVNDLFAATTRGENRELVQEMQAQVRHADAEGLANLTLGMAARPDRVALLPLIAVPTLVLCGAEDTVSPPEGMRDMAAAIPDSRFTLIPEAGHLSPLENPYAVNAAIREFLGELHAE